MTEAGCANIWRESGQLQSAHAHVPRAPRRSDTPVFVVEDPANASIGATIICGLVGGALAAAAGAVVAFRRGLGIQRLLHAKMSFMQNLLRGLDGTWKLYLVDDIQSLLRSDPVPAGGEGVGPG